MIEEKDDITVIEKSSDGTKESIGRRIYDATWVQYSWGKELDVRDKTDYEERSKHWEKNLEAERDGINLCAVGPEPFEL